MQSYRARLVRPTIFVAALVLLPPQESPPKRAHHALVYDEANERVLMTGGSSPFADGECCAFFNDLWAFDGKRWASLPASGDAMSGMRLVYDSRGKRVVSFGGYSNRQSRGDFRVLEGDAWKTLGVHEQPVAEPGFVYDSRRNRFIAFGGSAGRGRAAGETWESDGNAWTKLDATSPPARQAHIMVFDERRGRTIVFGGTGSGTPPNPPPRFGDTWEFDGERWIMLDAPGPSARHSSGAAYDSRRGLVVLFGGAGPDGFLADTWAWDGRVWKRLADASPTGPPARAMGYLAYDKSAIASCSSEAAKAGPTI